MQSDRLEVEVVGGEAGEESWSLGHFTLYGDTGQPEVWSEPYRLAAAPVAAQQRRAAAGEPACADAGLETEMVLDLRRA